MIFPHLHVVLCFRGPFFRSQRGLGLPRLGALLPPGGALLPVEEGVVLVRRRRRGRRRRQRTQGLPRPLGLLARGLSSACFKRGRVLLAGGGKGDEGVVGGGEKRANSLRVLQQDWERKKGREERTHTRTHSTRRSRYRMRGLPPAPLLH